MSFIPRSATASLEIKDAGFEAGYVTLGWDDADGDYFVMKLKSGSEWHSLYEGTDRATTLTGLSDGEYTYGLFTADGRNLGVRTIRIHHHPLSRALMFFGMGAFLFVFLLILLFQPANGHRPSES